MARNLCPISDPSVRESDLEWNMRDMAICYSPQANSQYIISIELFKRLRSLTQDSREMLVAWIIEQRRRGVSLPEVTTCIL